MSLAPALFLRRARGQSRAPVEESGPWGRSEQVEDPTLQPSPVHVLLLGGGEGCGCPGAPPAAAFGGPQGGRAPGSAEGWPHS